MTATLLGGVLPVFLIIGLGAALSRTRLLDQPVKLGLSRLVYFVCLPLLLFQKSAVGTSAPGAVGGLIALLGIATCVAVIAGLAAGRLLRLPKAGVGALAHAAFRGNLVFIGLPIVLYTIREAPEAMRAGLEATTILAMMPIVIVYNLLAVGLLLWHAPVPERAGHPLARAMVGFAKNPFIIACAAGLLVRFAHLPVPMLIQRTCEIMGAAAFPMALLCVGYEISTTQLAGGVRAALAASVLKVVFLPAIGFGLARALGLDPWTARVGVLLLACPTAVASYVLTEQMGGDAPLAAKAIVASTLLSIATFTVLALLPV